MPAWMGQWPALFVSVAIKSSVLLLLLLSAARMLRGASAATRHLMWVLGMIGLVALPILEIGLPPWRVVPVPEKNWYAESPTPVLPSAPDPAIVQASDPAAASSLPPRSTGRPVPIADAGLAIYLLGMLVVLGRYGRGWMRLGHLRREAQPMRAEGWQALSRNLSRRMGLDRAPEIRQSRRSVTPMTWGILRPIVLLPEGCDRWPASKRREVLLHELAHIRRRDCLGNGIAQTAGVIYWFNPLMWLALERMRVDRERACDDRVLSAGIAPSSYADHLLALALHLRSGGRPVPGGLAMARRSKIFERLDAILDPTRRRARPGRWATVIAIGLVSAAVLPLAVMGPAAEGGGLEYDYSVGRERRAFDREAAEWLAHTLTHLTPHGVPSMVGEGITWNCRLDGAKITMKLKGRVEFQDDETDLRWMDRGSRFKIEGRDGRRKIRLQARPGDDGHPVYDREIDPAVKAWLARSLPKVLMESGLGADARMARARREGEAIERLGQIDSPRSRGIHCVAYLALPGLSDREVATILRFASRNIPSDHVRGSVLRAYVDRYLARAETWGAFLDALSTMASDDEKGRTLSGALARPELTRQEIERVLQAVTTIRSDYTASRVLAEIDPAWLRDGDLRAAYFRTLQGLASPHERGCVLVALAPHVGELEALREAYLDAASRLSSAPERQRAIRALE